jgi:hypothetical protein
MPPISDEPGALLARDIIFPGNADPIGRPNSNERVSIHHASTLAAQKKHSSADQLDFSADRLDTLGLVLEASAIEIKVLKRMNARFGAGSRSFQRLRRFRASLSPFYLASMRRVRAPREGAA